MEQEKDSKDSKEERGMFTNSFGNVGKKEKREMEDLCMWNGVGRCQNM